MKLIINYRITLFKRWDRWDDPSILYTYGTTHMMYGTIYVWDGTDPFRHETTTLYLKEIDHEHSGKAEKIVVRLDRAYKW
jgi:hypothetical protein